MTHVTIEHVIIKNEITLIFLYFYRSNILNYEIDIFCTSICIMCITSGCFNERLFLMELKNYILKLH
jgi:hypothetical protein